MLKQFLLSHSFVRFLLANGIAAIANFGSRILFSRIVGFPIAIVLAFMIGLTTAFLLNHQFVFPNHTRELRHQILWFVAVNLFALAQTLAISLLLVSWLLPLLDVTSHTHEIAHAAGIVVPVFTSYIGHKRWTFR